MDYKVYIRNVITIYSGKFAVATALFVGFLLRFVYAHHYQYRMGEAQNAAIGLAKNGFISDVYHPRNSVFWPDGLPSAHLLPIPIGIAASIYSVFGIDSGTSDTILTVISISICLFGYLVFFKLFEVLGMRNHIRILCISVLCIIPINFRFEAEDFRFWEGGYAVLLMALSLLVFQVIDNLNYIREIHIILIAALNSLTFFVSPQFGLGGYACLLILAARKMHPRQWAVAALAVPITLAFFVYPWAIRNQRLMHHPILLRSNLGLELALAFNDNALNPDHGQGFLTQLSNIHPNADDNSYARMRLAGGETEYANILGVKTVEWIKNHKLDALSLAVRHLSDYLFPEPWMLNIYSTNKNKYLDYIIILIYWIVSIVGVISIIYNIIKSRSKFKYIATMLFVSSMPYLLVQPVLRYHYNTFALMMFMTFLLAQSVYDAGRLEAEQNKALV